MFKKIYYTRSGLSRCRGCAKHFFIDPVDQLNNACPFCGLLLTEQPVASPELNPSDGAKSRIAASLLTLGLGVAATGCEDEELVAATDIAALEQSVDFEPPPDQAYGGAPLFDQSPELERDIGFEPPPDQAYGGAPIFDRSPEIDMSSDFESTDQELNLDHSVIDLGESD